MNPSPSSNKPAMRRRPGRVSQEELQQRLALAEKATQEPVIRAMAESGLIPPAGTTPEPVKPPKNTQGRAGKGAKKPEPPAAPAIERERFPWEDMPKDADTLYSTRISKRLQEKIRFVATRSNTISNITEAALTVAVNELLRKRGIIVED